VYHIFADLAESKPARLVKCQSSDPLSSDAIVLIDGAILRILVANLTPHLQEVTIEGVTIDSYRIRILDHRTFEMAAFRPEYFRLHSGEVLSNRGRLSLRLGPYALARIDSETWSAIWGKM